MSASAKQNKKQPLLEEMKEEEDLSLKKNFISQKKESLRQQENTLKIEVEQQKKKHQEDQQNKIKEINDILDRGKNLEKLEEEYKKSRQREIPAYSTKIIYQCFHPFKDKIDVNKNEADFDRSSNYSKSNKASDFQKDLDPEDDALEYVLVLEEIIPPLFFQSSSEAANDNLKTIYLTKNISEEKKDNQQNYHKLNKKIQHDDDNSSDDDQQYFCSSDHKQTVYTKTKTEDILPNHKSISDHKIISDIRRWKDIDLNKKHLEEGKKQESSDIKSYDKKESIIIKRADQNIIFYDLNEEVNEDLKSEQFFKKYKITLWCINKKIESRFVVCQQTLTLTGEKNISVAFDRFSFSTDKKFLHITFCKEDDSLYKTVVLYSSNLEIVESQCIYYSQINKIKIKKKDSEISQNDKMIMFKINGSTQRAIETFQTDN